MFQDLPKRRRCFLCFQVEVGRQPSVMARSWLLKLPRTDDKDAHVLVYCQCKDEQSDLDLTLYATESEAPYKAKGRRVDHEKATSAG